MYSVFEELLKRNGKRVSDVVKATGIRPSTFSDWKKGLYMPKMDKLQLIADYFDVSIEYLTTGKDSEKNSTSGRSYYFDDNTAETAQELFDNPELKILFDAARDSRPEDLQMAADLLERLKKTNPDG